MKDVNKIILIGRLGKDPVQRETKTGLTVVQFSLATSRRVADSSEASGYKEETQWLNIVVWGKLAEHCKQYLGKGHKIFVEGMVKIRRFTHKDGTAGTSFEVHAEDIVFLGRGRSSLTEVTDTQSQAVESFDAPPAEASIAEAS